MRFLIEVTDDGHGMDGEDIARAAKRASQLVAEVNGVADEGHPSDLLAVNLGASHPAMRKPSR